MGWQTPPAQAPPWQLWPQLPQFATLELKSAQALVQTVWIPVHAVHAAFTQAAPDAQSAFEVHEARHSMGPQVNGAQEVGMEG